MYEEEKALLRSERKTFLAIREHSLHVHVKGIFVKSFDCDPLPVTVTAWLNHLGHQFGDDISK